MTTTLFAHRPVISADEARAAIATAEAALAAARQTIVAGGGLADVTEHIAAVCRATGRVLHSGRADRSTDPVVRAAAHRARQLSMAAVWL